jgi:soluble lytic murein transglycosylase-like protein
MGRSGQAATVRLTRGSVLAPLYRALAGVAATVFLFLALGGAALQKSGPPPTAVDAGITVALQHPLLATPPVATRELDALGEDVARRFRIATDAAHELVGAAVLAGQSSAIDPLLVLAVIAVESRFNPIAESDYGARGLMQVVARFHPDKVPAPNGDRALLDPWTNILVGTRILREYLDRTGNLEAALQMYGGAPEDAERGYSKKVLAELERFRRVTEAAAGPVAAARPM